MISIFQSVLGLLLLLLGRKLYWLFVGVVGFVLGVRFGLMIFPSEPEVVVLVIAIIAGVIGAILANFAQRLAIAIAGFLIGGYLVQYAVLQWADPTFAFSGLLLFIIGGILGVILILLLFDWALVILSSLFGAYLLLGAFNFGGIWQLLAFVILFLLGVFIQSRTVHDD